MRKHRHLLFWIGVALTALPAAARAEDGYRLWLRYETVEDKDLLDEYRIALGQVVFDGKTASPSLKAAAKELRRGLKGLLGNPSRAGNPAILLGLPEELGEFHNSDLSTELSGLGEEAYLVTQVSRNEQNQVVISGNSHQGILYGVFAFLRHLQTHQPLDELELKSSPRIQHRLLNHWDNLTRTIERTMTGASLWNWFDLPYYIEPRYINYARACASIGINGTVLTNVNANATVLRPQFLEKVAALADTFRPYGIRVYLTARFSAPMEIGSLETADPLDATVVAWWQAKVNEIYTYVPDFGGFLVKANSEGQPGPQNYGRNHTDGANLLARALAPHGGIVMWRAFVYDFQIQEDRHKQAYNEFIPLDGQFEPNVLIQTKNGAIDFMPREPFHPLFGATPQTPQALELQITQEYLGGDVHLAFLAPMWKETLDSDTFARGSGSTVAKVVDGSVFNHALTAMAGVSNAGNERNWTGHPMAAANWYAFGRLAWDHSLPSEAIAEEWTRMTFGNDDISLETIRSILLESHQAVVDYSMPLGLHHIMAAGHHYGPGPWYDQGRPDWTSVYYHQADENGIGFDRTKTGSDALGQYADEVIQEWGDPETISDKYLLWFHHVSWDHPMESGRTLWDELCARYQRGVDRVDSWQTRWNSLKNEIDNQRHHRVAALLKRQHMEARFYKDACLSYFQTFSKRPFPLDVEAPLHDLDYYRNFMLYHVPGDPSEH